MAQAQIPLPMDAIAEFCRKWRIRELALFGSVLRDDFRPDSDIDVLVTFDDAAEWSLLDHVRMQDELGGIVGRQVDVLTRRSVERSENPRRKHEILSTAHTVYAA
jgi:predicted nucleotidyltransferase